MMRRFWILWSAIIGASLIFCVTQLPAAVSLDPGAERAVRQYLAAYVQDDRPTLQQFVPHQLKNRFGPCEFTRLPQLTNPRVDSPRAWIDFSGPSKDPSLSDHGMIRLQRIHRRTTREWRVTHIFWYDKAPPESLVIRRSVTAEDRQDEPRATAVARAYLEAWLKSDYEKMAQLSFDWTQKPRPQGNPLRLTDLRLQPLASGSEGTKVACEGKVVVYRILPRSFSGLVYVFKEGNDWKVRGTNVNLGF